MNVFQTLLLSHGSLVQPALNQKYYTQPEDSQFQHQMEKHHSKATF